MSFIECNCNTDGSTNGNCDHIGKCMCKTGIDGFSQRFSGEKCEKCQDGFYGFPFCKGRSLFSLFVKENISIHVPLFHVILLSLQAVNVINKVQKVLHVTKMECAPASQTFLETNVKNVLRDLFDFQTAKVGLFCIIFQRNSLILP